MKHDDSDKTDGVRDLGHSCGGVGNGDNSGNDRGSVQTVFSTPHTSSQAPPSTKLYQRCWLFSMRGSNPCSISTLTCRKFPLDVYSPTAQFPRSTFKRRRRVMGWAVSLSLKHSWTRPWRLIGVIVESIAALSLCVCSNLTIDCMKVS